MSVGISQAAFNRYATASATFSITFPRHNENEVRVYVEDSSTGVLTALALATDYTLSGILPASGNATLTLVDNANPPPDQPWLDGGGLLLNTSYSIIIEYVPVGKQENSFANLGRFAPISFEKSLDQLTMTVKAQERILGRTIQFLPKDINAGYDPKFPTTIVGNADKVIAVNDTEDGIKYGPTTASIAADAAAASASAGDAAAAQLAAETAQVAAELAQTGAETAQTGAELAQTNAETAQTAAEAAQVAAELAETQAEFNAFLDAYTNQVSVTAASSPVTVAEDTLYVCDTTGGDIIFNLPALSGLAATWKAGFLKAVDDINNIIVDGNGTETVAGGLTRVSAAIGVGILVYPDTATNWNGPFYTAGFTPGGSGGAGGGGFTFVANQDIAAVGQINPNAIAPQQWLKVTGAAGPQTTSTTPLDTTPADGTVIVFEGQSDVNTLTIPYSDTAGGFVGNGNAVLRAGSTLTVAYDGSANRLKEIQRKI